jgi:hypothetical protein
MHDDAVDDRYWQPHNHHRGSQHLQAIVESMLKIRTIEHRPRNVLALLPNELMFVIFSFLPYPCTETEIDARSSRVLIDGCE